jgi:hypothetical protein
MKLRKKYTVQDVLERTYVTKSVLVANSEQDYLDENLMSYVRPILETEDHVLSVYKTPYYLYDDEPKLHYESMVKIETKASFNANYMSLGEVVSTLELRPYTFDDASLLFHSQLLNLGLIQNVDMSSIDLNNIMLYRVSNEDLLNEKPFKSDDLSFISSTEILTLILENNKMFDDYMLMNYLVDAYITCHNKISYFKQGTPEQVDTTKENIQREIDEAVKTNALEFITKNKDDIQDILKSPYLLDSVHYSNKHNKKQINYDKEANVIEKLDAEDLKNLYLADCYLALEDLKELNNEYHTNKEHYEEIISSTQKLMDTCITALYAYQIDYGILENPSGKALLQNINMEEADKKDSSSTIVDGHALGTSLKS